MRYHIQIAREVPGVPLEYIPVGVVENEGVSPVLESRLTAHLLEGAQRAIAETSPPPEGLPASMTPGRKTGRKAKPVIVRAIDPEREPYVSVRVGELIESSMTLSLLLGYKYNMASQALSLAAARHRDELANEKDLDERRKIKDEIIEATLRDVTFCYQEELLKDVSI